MQVKITGVKKLSKKLGIIEAELLPRVKTGVNKATIMVEGSAKAFCPTNRYRAGGELRQSIHPDTKVYPDAVIGRVLTTKEYAAFVEFGTGIKGQISNQNHRIPLAYRQTPWTYTPDDGESFYTTIGNVAQPFLYPALRSNKQRIKLILAESIKGITK